MDNKLQKTGQNSLMDNFVKTDDILNDMCGIIESSQKAAYQAVNIALVQRNWLLGYRIAEEELGGQERSEYGLQIIKKLSKELTNRYGKGYDKGTLYRCLKFYKMFPKIVATLGQQSVLFFVPIQMMILPVILLCTVMNNYLLPSTNYTCRQKKN